MTHIYYPVTDFESHPAGTGKRIKELEAQVQRAEAMLEREIRRIQKIQFNLPPPHKVGLAYVQAEYQLMLAELKGQDDE